MQSCYPEAIIRVLKSEGGYVNEPKDPGGPTNFGITQAVYQVNGHPGASAADVKAMKLDEAKRIYKVRYADPCRFDELPAGLDYALFDYAVNSGVGRANKVIRRVCSLPDNATWPTLSMAIDKRDPKVLISTVDDERLRFLSSLSTWSVFGRGWAARVRSVNAAALAMNKGGAPAPSAQPPVIVPSTGKGIAPKPNLTKPVVIGTGTGGSAATVTWFDWAMAHPVVGVMIAVAVLVVVVGIAEFIARRLQASKQDAVTPGVVPVPELAH